MAGTRWIRVPAAWWSNPCDPISHAMAVWSTAMRSTTMFDVEDRLLGLMNRRVEMADGAIAQATCHRIVLFARDIVVHLVQQLQRLVQPPRAIGRYIGGRMIMHILAVIDGRTL